MTKLERYREQITQDMDLLQAMMESNTHISNPQKVLDHMETIRFKWVFLSEEDRDYIHGCDFAIEEQTRWNTDDN